MLRALGTFQAPWFVCRTVLLIGSRKVKVFMGQAEPPKYKLPKVPLEISGMFSIQVLATSRLMDLVIIKAIFSLLTTLEEREGPGPTTSLEMTPGW